jgi:hypothetical protein
MGFDVETLGEVMQVFWGFILVGKKINRLDE